MSDADPVGASTIGGVQEVVLRVDDPAAHDYLWEYAQRRRAADPVAADDLEIALVAAGFPVVVCANCLRCHRVILSETRQGDGCASSVWNQGGRWFLAGAYGSRVADMCLYRFVEGEPVTPLSPLCDECIQRQIDAGVLELVDDSYLGDPDALAALGFGPVLMGERPIQFEVSVKAIVVRDSRVLVLLRGSSSGDRSWDLPGGRLARVASLVDELARSLREEVSPEITIESCDLVSVRLRGGDASSLPEVLLYYSVVLRPWSWEVTPSEEYDGVAFVGPRELGEEVVDGVRLESELRDLLRRYLGLGPGPIVVDRADLGGES